MNWLKKGPELKLSALKVPDFLDDLFYDLKERHLLPLVAILLVALIALPILLSNDGSAEEPGAASSTIATGSSADSGEALVVARSEPQLRDPARRLRGAQALDPFSRKQAGGSEEEPESSATTGEETAVEEPVTEIATEVGAEADSTTSEGGVPGAAAGQESTATTSESRPTKTRYASDAIDVRVVSLRDSSARQDKKREPTTAVRRDLPELTMLPARSTPAATFMGTSRDGKKALLLVSSDVVALFGEGTCVIGSQTCQLLALEPGLPETFVYGPQERRYRIEVLKIEQTLSAEPRRAALGKTSGKHVGGGKGKSSDGTGNGPAGRG